MLKNIQLRRVSPSLILIGSENLPSSIVAVNTSRLANNRKQALVILPDHNPVLHNVHPEAD